MTVKDMSYMYPSFPVIGTIAMLLCLYPVPAHWKAGNIATTSLAMWTSIGLFMCVIDTCVWHGNIRNPYPFWGDIFNLYFAVISTAIACCSFCIQYRLWKIARAKTVFVTRDEKGRQRLVTCFWCFGIPIIVAGLHYIVQGHRYNLIEDLGPVTDTYNVTLSYALYWIWDPAICIAGGIYGILTIRLIFKRRKLFDQVLNSATKLNREHYVRLLCLASFSFLVHIPLTTWVVVVNATQYPVYPWISWQDTHSDYGRIGYVTRFMLSTMGNQALYMSISWWSLPFSALSFFAFFGIGDASKPYEPIIAACLKPFGIKYPREKRRKTTRKTWIDILLCRPGQPVSSSGSAPSASIPRFATNASGSRSSGRARTTTVGSSTSSGITHIDFLSFGDVMTQGNDVGALEDTKTKDDVDPSTSTKVAFDIESQKAPTETTDQRRSTLIVERDPELTEEVTF